MAAEEAAIGALWALAERSEAGKASGDYTDIDHRAQLDRMVDESAEDVRRARIRAASAAMARRITQSPEAQAPAGFWRPPARRGFSVAEFAAGAMVVADWYGDTPPKEPNKPRPAGVIEGEALFGPDCPNVNLSDPQQCLLPTDFKAVRWF